VFAVGRGGVHFGQGLPRCLNASGLPHARSRRNVGNCRAQPRWGRPLGALIAVVILVAVTRGAWEIVVGTAVVVLLVSGYLLRRQVRRQSVYDHRGR
jgi:hypothetical protein